MRSTAWLAVCLLCGMSSFGQGQRKVAPPPKPADSGPSLAATMQFIQEQIGERGKVNYAAYFHDNIAGTDFAQQESVEASNIIANSAACSVTYHWKSMLNGNVLADQNAGIAFHDVRSIEVMTGEQSMKRANTAAGHPSYDSKIDPPTFVLEITRKGGVKNYLYFTGEDMANRVAKAIVHAADLCGGGNKDPF